LNIDSLLLSPATLTIKLSKQEQRVCRHHREKEIAERVRRIDLSTKQINSRREKSRTRTLKKLLRYRLVNSSTI